MKNKFFVTLTSLLVIIFCLSISEVLIRRFSPQGYLYGGFVFTKEYGHLPVANSKIVVGVPGKWRFIYTVNEYYGRGKIIPSPNVAGENNIVILGDSYSFGYGVEDGQEYPAVMSEKLSPDFNVINLGEPGWGLTQEIKRYYELGALYSPKIVILQFCVNDPEDNFVNLVTTIENGKFKFQDTNLKTNAAREYIRAIMQNSPVKKLQVYWLLRKAICNIRWERKNMMSAEVNAATTVENNYPAISPAERFYNELLELFAADLKRENIKLIFISIDDEIGKFINIKKKIWELNARGLMVYYHTDDWLGGTVENTISPEGHYWDKAAHYIIADRLSQIISN